MGEVTVSKFTIDSKDAELAIQRTDRVLQLMQKTLAEAKAELSSLFVDNTGNIKNQAGALDQHQKSTVGGSKAIKDFRAEQRLQSFVVREGTQALTGMVLALNFLTQGQDKNDSSTRKLTEALTAGIVAMNSTEFALFGLGRAGASLGGTLGKVFLGISRFGGPIALVVGLLATLVTAFSETNKAADKAASEGLEKFEDRLKRFSLAKQQTEINALRKRIADENELIRVFDFKIKLDGDPSGELAKRMESTRERLKASKEELVTRLKVRDTLIEENRELKKKGGFSEIRKLELERLNKQLEEFRGKPEARSALQSRIELLKREIQELDKTPLDKLREAMEKAEKAPKAVPAIEMMKQLQEEAEEARKKIEEAIGLLYPGMVAPKPPKPKAPDDYEAPGLIARLETEARALDQAIRMTDEETTINALKRERAALQLRINALLETELEKQQRLIDDMRQGFSELEQGLNAVGLKSDSLVNRLLQAAQTALRVAQLIAQAGEREGGASTGDAMGIIGSILKIVGLVSGTGGFAGGGYTGPGQPSDVAGLVHRREMVFEEPIVRGNLPDLLTLRRALQQGVSARTYLSPQAMQGDGNSGAVIARLDRLERAIREMPAPIVEVNNPITLEKGLRVSMPRYEDYRQKKEPE